MDKMKIDWSKFANLEYWLEGIAGNTSVTPPIDKNSSFFWFFLYFFSSFVILGIALRVSEAFLHTQHPFQKKFPLWGNNFIWMGILGLAWFTMRELTIGFLGARIWLLAGLIWFIILMYFVVRYFFLFYKLESNYFKNQVSQI